MSSQIEKFKKLEEKNRIAELGGGQDRIDRQHQANRKTARERMFRMSNVDAITFDTQGSLIQPLVEFFKMRERRY